MLYPLSYEGARSQGTCQRLSTSARDHHTPPTFTASTADRTAIMILVAVTCLPSSTTTNHRGRPLLLTQVPLRWSHARSRQA